MKKQTLIDKNIGLALYNEMAMCRFYEEAERATARALNKLEIELLGFNRFAFFPMNPNPKYKITRGKIMYNCVEYILEEKRTNNGSEYFLYDINSRLVSKSANMNELFAQLKHQ